MSPSFSTSQNHNLNQIAIKYGAAGRKQFLVSLSYNASPVPAPIRRSFDTQLSNQDLAQVFGNDERRLVWIDERFQQRRVATVFIHQSRRCRLRESMDDQTFQRRADLHLVRVSREPNKYRIQKK